MTPSDLQSRDRLRRDLRERANHAESLGKRPRVGAEALRALLDDQAKLDRLVEAVRLQREATSRRPLDEYVDLVIKG